MTYLLSDIENSRVNRLEDRNDTLYNRFEAWYLDNPFYEDAASYQPEIYKLSPSNILSIPNETKSIVYEEKETKIPIEVYDKSEFDMELVVMISQLKEHDIKTSEYMSTETDAFYTILGKIIKEERKAIELKKAIVDKYISDKNKIKGLYKNKYSSKYKNNSDHLQWLTLHSGIDTKANKKTIDNMFEFFINTEEEKKKFNEDPYDGVHTEEGGDTNLYNITNQCMSRVMPFMPNGFFIFFPPHKWESVLQITMPKLLNTTSPWIYQYFPLAIMEGHMNTMNEYTMYDGYYGGMTLNSLDFILASKQVSTLKIMALMYKSISLRLKDSLSFYMQGEELESNIIENIPIWIEKGENENEFIMTNIDDHFNIFQLNNYLVTNNTKKKIFSIETIDEGRKKLITLKEDNYNVVKYVGSTSKDLQVISLLFSMEKDNPELMKDMKMELIKVEDVDHLKEEFIVSEENPQTYYDKMYLTLATSVK